MALKSKELPSTTTSFFNVLPFVKIFSEMTLLCQV